MFCFCLQSSLLKLQALEVDGVPSLGPSPEESPPALGSKEQKSPCGPAELGGLEAKTLALCHSVPADENSPPGSTPVCLSVLGGGGGSVTSVVVFRKRCLGSVAVLVSVYFRITSPSFLLLFP